MALPGQITIPFGDGRHPFALPLGQVRELQEKTGGIGPLMLLRRIQGGSWLIDDLRETIRLGLIGGGMAPVEALKLVERYCDARPPAEYAPSAHAVLLAFINGVPESKKKSGVKASGKTTTEPDASTSTKSTDPAQP